MICGKLCNDSSVLAWPDGTELLINYEQDCWASLVYIEAYRCMFEVEEVIPVRRRGAKASPGPCSWGPCINPGAASNPRLMKDRVRHLEGFH